ncbi:hypothetical protein L2E82_16685 [Cichorium intybus]|uniref:Uncharacterized protein n=1 Tax=Cichorium intybus TaxID=13427 RepID=A0ACB9F679_CICIN|nr:hypothetical protein L2E82_16685 [Cichorium intybus]
MHHRRLPLLHPPPSMMYASPTSTGDPCTRPLSLSLLLRFFEPSPSSERRQHGVQPFNRCGFQAIWKTLFVAFKLLVYSAGKEEEDGEPMIGSPWTWLGSNNDGGVHSKYVIRLLYCRYKAFDEPEGIEVAWNQIGFLIS